MREAIEWTALFQLAGCLTQRLLKCVRLASVAFIYTLIAPTMSGITTRRLFPGALKRSFPRINPAAVTQTLQPLRSGSFHGLYRAIFDNCIAVSNCCGDQKGCPDWSPPFPSPSGVVTFAGPFREL
jgi:hypothetical protein